MEFDLGYFKPQFSTFATTLQKLPAKPEKKKYFKQTKASLNLQFLQVTNTILMNTVSDVNNI